MVNKNLRKNKKFYPKITLKNGETCNFSYTDSSLQNTLTSDCKSVITAIKLNCCAISATNTVETTSALLAYLF